MRVKMARIQAMTTETKTTEEETMPMRLDYIAMVLRFLMRKAHWNVLAQTCQQQCERLPVFYTVMRWKF